MLTFAGSSDERPERERELAEAFARARRRRADRSRRRAATTATCSATAPPAWRSCSSTARRASLDADVVLARQRAAGPRRRSSTCSPHGHRRIAFLGDRPELYTAAERLRGYREALARRTASRAGPGARRAAADERPGDVPRASCWRATTRPRRCSPSQNLITIGALRALHALGVQQRASRIVGFDDVPLADVVEPGLTVVAQDPVALGRSGRRAAVRAPRRRRRPVAARDRCRRPLIARGSGEIAPRSAS